MAKTTTAPFTQTIINFGATLVKNTGASVAAATDAAGPVPTNVVLLTTAGAEGSIVNSLMAASDDSAARYLQLWRSMDAGITYRLLGCVAIGALAGNGAAGVTANVDLLANSVITGLSYDQMGKPVLQLMANARLYVGTTAAITTLKHIAVTGTQENF